MILARSRRPSAPKKMRKAILGASGTSKNIEKIRLGATGTSKDIENTVTRRDAWIRTVPPPAATHRDA